MIMIIITTSDDDEEEDGHIANGVAYSGCGEPPQGRTAQQMPPGSCGAVNLPYLKSCA